MKPRYFVTCFMLCYGYVFGLNLAPLLIFAARDAGLCRRSICLFISKFVGGLLVCFFYRVLQPKNRMDIEDLLNPREESQMMDGVRDEEICQAVLATRNAQEEGPINGGDDDVEDDSPLEPCPTRHEVFWAASGINRYVEHLDDPHASLKQLWPLSNVKYIWRNPGQCPPPSH